MIDKIDGNNKRFKSKDKVIDVTKIVELSLTGSLLFLVYLDSSIYVFLAFCLVAARLELWDLRVRKLWRLHLGAGNAHVVHVFDVGQFHVSFSANPNVNDPVGSSKAHSGGDQSCH